MKFIEAYLESLPRETTGKIRLDKLVGYFHDFRTAIKEGDASNLGRKRGFKVKKIVDCIEFIESKDYFAFESKLWASQKEDLWRIWHTKPAPFEVILTGAQGVAKSWTAVFITCYTLYLLSCMHKPQAELRMVGNDEIFVIIQSFKLDTAEDALFNRIIHCVDNSPWFQKHFPRNTKLNSEIHFPHHVIVKPITGTINAVQSKNVVGGCITEINEMPIHKKSVKLEQTDKQVLDVGAEAFRNFKNRVMGRYKKLIQDGDFPGKIVIDSARRYLGDFTDRKTQEAKNNPKILVIGRSLWSAKPFDYEGEDWFFVELATEYRPARVLAHIEEAEQWSDEYYRQKKKWTDEEWLKDNLHCIRVPESHRQDFEEGLEDALRDFAGVPAMATGRFMPYPREITAARDKFVARTGGQSLFKVEEVVLKKDMPWHELINYEYLEQLVLEGDFRWAVHLDASLGVTDAAGMGITRVVDKKVEKKGYFWDQESQQLRRVENVEMPIFCVDGALRVLAPPGQHIDLVMLQDVVLELKEHIAIFWATVDWMQSEQTIQTWRSHGIIAGSQSVDKSAGPYYIFSQAVRDGRIMWPQHEVLDAEVRQLKREIRGGDIKIDHPNNFHKDVADGVCGSVATCYRFFKKKIVTPDASNSQPTSRPQQAPQAQPRPLPMATTGPTPEEIEKATNPYGPNSIINNPDAGGKRAGGWGKG